MKSLNFDSPVGNLLIRADEESIIEVSFADDELVGANSANECGLLQKCALELDMYFAGKLKDFTVPLKLIGTDFRKKCWEALRTIPFGETISYKELATKIGNPKACRAVGGANHHNPIVIIVPCHRVIGAGGNLTGFGGGLDKKRFLLELERKFNDLRN